MDKHHLLRRPAGSSIHGCNICGKEGHRAADCPNGSAVNWVERFGPNWTVDVDAIAAEARREPDYDALAKRAKAYACLLYTSPSPRDQRGSRMPSSA